MFNNALFSTKDNTWETPIDFFNKLNDVFKFDVDVCANDDTAKCSKYYTVKEDGLSQEWYGNCWMNPPYNREQISWLHKASNEVDKNASLVACLVPARPDTRVWHDIIFKKSVAICFIKGRLKFGDSTSSAPFPSALIIFGKELNNKLKEVLNNMGCLITFDRG